ncbi:MAG: helix-turn-helix domain-containing protein [Ruminococcaceae bacterium]|nr:helix-turn-helix domain-containing protein [Oscillospiraceae bacterium]
MFRLKEIRKEHKKSQEELAKLLGVTQATLSGWENEKYEIDNKSLIKCAEILNVSVDYLLGRSDERTASSPNAIKIPVLGSVPAGIPLEAIEDIIGEEEIPSSWLAGGKEFFALKIKGDSMEPEYRTGDIVIFKKQSDCESGEDCIVMINGDEATFKRVEKISGGILVKPLNPDYPTLHFSSDDIEKTPVKITGVAWELRRSRRG